MSDQQQSTTQAFPSSDQQQSSTQAFVKKTAAQRELYESGNELAAYAAKQINYHIMGYYPITPSTAVLLFALFQYNLANGILPVA